MLPLLLIMPLSPPSHPILHQGTDKARGGRQEKRKAQGRGGGRDDDDELVWSWHDPTHQLHTLPLQVVCPKCSHNKAVFNEMQTRSADEPMTIYYCCQSCKHTWNSL